MQTQRHAHTGWDGLRWQRYWGEGVEGEAWGSCWSLDVALDQGYSLQFLRVDSYLLPFRTVHILNALWLWTTQTWKRKKEPRICILSHLLLSFYLKGSGWTTFGPEGRNRPVGEQQDSGLHPVHTPGHWELSKWNQRKISQSLTLRPPLSQSLLSFTNGSVPLIPWSAFMSFCLKFKAFCPRSIRPHSIE